MHDAWAWPVSISLFYYSSQAGRRSSPDFSLCLHMEASLYWLPPILPPYFAPIPILIPIPSVRFSQCEHKQTMCIKIRWLFCGCWRARRNRQNRLRKNIDAGSGFAPRAIQYPKPKPNTFGHHVLLHFLLAILCGHL